MTRGQGHSIRERGQAVVELALIVPIMLIICLGCADLTLMVASSRQAQSAAQAAAHEAAVLLEAKSNGAVVEDPDEDYLRDFICQRYPALASQSVNMSIVPHEVEETTYLHKVYATPDSEPEARESTVKREAIEVTLSFDRDFATPVGPILSAISNSPQSRSFHVDASCVAPYDSTGIGW